ncbi:hypothetical protein AB5I41_24890 [Sphingomonas sp. MMS24-JH45]
MTGPAPFDDESLIGLVSRAAATNHEQRTVTITKAVWRSAMDTAISPRGTISTSPSSPGEEDCSA